MPITYTNRKGITYTLCHGTTKTGKPRYYFTRAPKDQDLVLDTIPDGREISESVNGVVSLVKSRAQQITPAEVASVRTALEHHVKGHRYLVDAKADQILVYEQVGADADEILDGMSQLLGSNLEIAAQHLREITTARAQYTPVLRFMLIDAEQRTFAVERMCYRGSWEGWLDIYRNGDIDTLTKELIPMLGTDDFFELY